MKKVICFAIILTSLFLVSCGESSVPIVYSTPSATAATTSTLGTSGTNIPAASTAPTGTTATTTTTATATTAASAAATEKTETTTAATTATTASTQIVTPTARASDLSGYRPRLLKTIETKSKVLLIDRTVSKTPVTIYYSKADGEFYPFCFDPFCNHENYENYTYKTKCIGNMIYDTMRATPSSEDVFYINSRLYFVFFDKIYSCSEFATDLRVEVSFSDKMDYYEKVTDHLKNGTKISGPYYTPIQSFVCDGRILLFIRLDEHGNIIQYAYDTVTRKLSSLREKMAEAEKSLGATLYTMSYDNGYIYMAAYRNVDSVSIKMGMGTEVFGDEVEFVGLYVADYQFKTFSKTDSLPPKAYDFKTDDGFIVVNMLNEENTVGELVRVDLNGRTTKISPTVEFKSEPFCRYLTDKSLYFCYYDPVELGKELHDETMTISNSSGGKMYRLDLKTGEISKIFDDLTLEMGDIYYLDETSRYGITRLQIYTFYGEKVATKGGLLYQFRLDENGNIVDLEKVELE